MNAILCLLRTGCQWRYLPRDRFPLRSTVYNIFRKFQRDGVSEATSPNCTWRCPSRRPRGQPRGCGSRQPISQIGRKASRKDNQMGSSARKQVTGRKNPRLGRQRRAADAFLTLASMQLALRRLARA
jgi:putative transposase